MNIARETYSFVGQTIVEAIRPSYNYYSLNEEDVRIAVEVGDIIGKHYSRALSTGSTIECSGLSASYMKIHNWIYISSRFSRNSEANASRFLESKNKLKSTSANK